MKKSLLLLCATLLLCSCEGEGERRTSVADTAKTKPFVICEIKALANKSPKQLEQILGKHTPENGKIEPIKDGPCGRVPCEQHEYSGGDIEVVFVNHKADWITIKPSMPIAFNSKAIAALGIQNAAPSFENPGNTIRWEFINGIRQISTFPNQSGNVDYFYVECTTAP